MSTTISTSHTNFQNYVKYFKRNKLYPPWKMELATTPIYVRSTQWDLKLITFKYLS